MPFPINKQVGPFAAIKVAQKGSYFLLCSIPASQIVNLCGGLASSPSRKNSPDSMGGIDQEDVQSLVTALESSAFAAEVANVQSTTYQPEDPYQRLMDRSRAKAISNYLQTEDALLPNAIILATNEGVSVIHDNNTVTLTWDSQEVDQPLNIIDGQHRVEGLRILVSEKPDLFDNFQIPATLLLDLPFYAQAELFATINGEQKKVNKSQIFDLLGYKPISDPTLKEKAYLGEMAIQRFCHDAVKVLNTSQKSPWHGRFKMRGSGEGIVTQAAFVDHLAAYSAPKKSRTNARYLPVLFPFVKNKDLVGLARLLLIYFVGVKSAKPTFWESDATLSASLFGKTNGVAVLFHILHDLICFAGGASKLTIAIVSEYWSKVSDNVIANPPPGGSKGYQAKVTAEVLLMMLGPDAEKDLAGRRENIREQLINDGGLS